MPKNPNLLEVRVRPDNQQPNSVSLVLAKQEWEDEGWVNQQVANLPLINNILNKSMLSKAEA